MSGEIKLHGYKYSVYTRIARTVLHLKEVEYQTVEVDPFDEISPDYRAMNPFGRVPVLEHGSMVLFETGAVTRYIDRTFLGPVLQPVHTDALARMDQVMSVIDNYAYWPLVRQVFSQAFFRPFIGETCDKAEVLAGLTASETALEFFEKVAVEGFFLNGDSITLADCHLAPMIDYFCKTKEGSALFTTFPKLQSWWDKVSGSAMLQATDPFNSTEPTE